MIAAALGTLPRSQDTYIGFLEHVIVAAGHYENRMYSRRCQNVDALYRKILIRCDR